MVVEGFVLAADGAPVRGAAVFFSLAPAPLPDVAALTGDDGSFSLSTPHSGVHRVRCSAPDGRAA